MLLAALVYALQLYADFSGGIDISRGVAQMFGITMGENFRRPYFRARSPSTGTAGTISLGDWLRNYLFYPLSISKAFLNWGRHAKQHLGNHRQGPADGRGLAHHVPRHRYLARRELKYVAFGFWNGMVILVSTLLQPVSTKSSPDCTSSASAWYQVFSMLRTFVVVLIGYYLTLPTASAPPWA